MQLYSLKHQRIEQQLLGIEFLRTPSVDPPEQLIYLVLEHRDVALGGLELFGEFFDLKLLLLEELVGLCE